MKSANKEIVSGEEQRRREATGGVQDFMFPGNPPVTIKAKSVEDAEEEYRKITSKINTK